MVSNYFSFSFSKSCYLSEFFASCVYVPIKRHVDTADCECTEMEKIPCVHFAARKTEGFVVLSHSKLDLYQDDLLYVRVINSSQWAFFVVYHEMWITSTHTTGLSGLPRNKKRKLCVCVCVCVCVAMSTFSPVGELSRNGMRMCVCVCVCVCACVCVDGMNLNYALSK